MNNRELQIECLNPKIARLTLGAAYGAYDPVFLADARKESASDSGGFDPADYSRDAIYAADSDVASLGLTGLLPLGASYTLSGNFAHNYGLRNGYNFDSYNLFAGISIRQPLLRNFWTDYVRTTLQINRKNMGITDRADASLRPAERLIPVPEIFDPPERWQHGLASQAELRVKQREESVLWEISDALQAAEFALKRVALTREAMKFAKAALTAEEQKLAAGKSAIFTVLELQSSLAAAQTEHLSAKADYGQALAQLHFAEASSLERNQIELELY